MPQSIKISSSSKDRIPGSESDSVVAECTGRAAKNMLCEVYGSSGLYTVPVNGDIGVSITIGENRIIVATNDYKFSLPINSGETILYSRDSSGVMKSYTWHKSTGEILLKNDNGNYKLEQSGNHVFNDGTESAVKFSELKSGFDTLVANFNTEIGKIATALNSIVPGSYTATPSTANVDNSEVVEVKIP